MGCSKVIVKRRWPFFVFSAWSLLGSPHAFAQTDSLSYPPALSTPQRDVFDLIQRIFPHHHFNNRNADGLQPGQKLILLLPQVGYAPQTRFLAQVTASIAFRNPQANVSSILSSLAYTLNKQLIFSTQASLWGAHNSWNFISDWRLMHYPQSTHGLGMNTALDNEIHMDYDYLRLYQSALKRMGQNLYVGLGYNLDYRWNIVSYNTRHELTRISRYPYGVTGTSVSSGPTFNVLYDNRANSINPGQGFYTNLSLRTYYKALGSTNTYQSLLIDVRKYVHFPESSSNVWAFWSYNVLTLNGNPPFLDLPSTGWDTYSNTGRGFVQGRFRGKKLIYTETEYRYAISRNGLLGGVVFANAQSVSEPRANQFDKIALATGAGLRVRLNKITRANLAIDYGFGSDGSHGLFFNFGEVF